MLDRLGQTGRGIQDTAFGNQYTAATQMADEPFMRMQRAMALMGGLAGFLPSYQTGYGSSMAPISGSRGPSGFGRVASGIGTGLSIFNTLAEWVVNNKILGRNWSIIKKHETKHS